MRAMRSRESVIDKDIGQCGKGFHKLRIIGLFPRMIARILKHENLPVCHGGGCLHGRITHAEVHDTNAGGYAAGAPAAPKEEGGRFSHCEVDRQSPAAPGHRDRLCFHPEGGYRVDLGGGVPLYIPT